MPLEYAEADMSLTALMGRWFSIEPLIPWFSLSLYTAMVGLWALTRLKDIRGSAEAGNRGGTVALSWVMRCGLL
jgi:hypothetical protein